ncbi:unnamed protein product [Prorocentrum cordatum]|uniref:RNA-directed RNA polymerase n=1 Tax=Prorocentrum cordatum TaxID=2364126 RepID=A0ABN9UFC3_9DINO|nr:unnamed protein product [Polarella glacialis]
MAGCSGCSAPSEPAAPARGRGAGLSEWHARHSRRPARLAQLLAAWLRGSRRARATRQVAAALARGRTESVLRLSLAAWRRLCADAASGRRADASQREARARLCSHLDRLAHLGGGRGARLASLSQATAAWRGLARELRGARRLALALGGASFTPGRVTRTALCGWSSSSREMLARGVLVAWYRQLASSFNAKATLKAIDALIPRSEEMIARAAFIAWHRLLASNCNAKSMLRAMDILVPRSEESIAREIVAAWYQQLKSSYNTKMILKVIAAWPPQSERRIVRDAFVVWRQLFASDFNAKSMLRAIDTWVPTSEERIAKEAFFAWKQQMKSSLNAELMLRVIDTWAPSSRERSARDAFVAWYRLVTSKFNAIALLKKAMAPWALRSEQSVARAAFVAWYQLLTSSFNAKLISKAIETRVPWSDQLAMRTAFVAWYRLLASSFNTKLMLKAMDTLAPRSEEELARAAFVAWYWLFASSFKAKLVLKSITDMWAPRSEKRTTKAAFVAWNKLLASSFNAKVMLKAMDAWAPRFDHRIAMGAFVAWHRLLASSINANAMLKAMDAWSPRFEQRITRGAFVAWHRLLASSINANAMLKAMDAWAPRFERRIARDAFVAWHRLLSSSINAIAMLKTMDAWAPRFEQRIARGAFVAWHRLLASSINANAMLKAMDAWAPRFEQRIARGAFVAWHRLLANSINANAMLKALDSWAPRFERRIARGAFVAWHRLLASRINANAMLKAMDAWAPRFDQRITRGAFVAWHRLLASSINANAMLKAMDSWAPRFERRIARDALVAWHRLLASRINAIAMLKAMDAWAPRFEQRIARSIFVAWHQLVANSHNIDAVLKALDARAPRSAGINARGVFVAWSGLRPKALTIQAVRQRTRSQRMLTKHRAFAEWHRRSRSCTAASHLVDQAEAVAEALMLAQAPPCEAAPAVCPAPELVQALAEPETDPLGALLAAAPGVLVALLLEGLEWWRLLSPGQRLVVRYSDDQVDHERVLLYPSLPPGTWAALTPDGDEYEEDYTGASPETGPEGAALMPAGGGAPEGWPRPIYRFRAPLSVEELKAAIMRGRALVEERLPGIAPGPPAEVACPDDRLVEWADFFGEVRRPALRRQRGKQPAAPLEDDRVWVVAEPTESAAVGTAVDRSDDRFVPATALVGLFAFPEGPRRVEALLAGDLPGYAARRRHEMGLSDFPAAEPDREGAAPAGMADLRERLGRPAGAGGAGKPDEVGGTVNLGGLMCLETAARRIAGLVAVYSDPAKPARGRARLCTGAASSDDIAGQALLQFATRKIMEQQEAQAVLSHGKGPQRAEGDGTNDEGGKGVTRGRLAASRCARELFPLPRWRLPELPVAGPIRSMALRRRERLVFKMGNEAVDALNWLAGFRNGPTYFDPDPMQLEVLERICELASRRHPGPDALSERAAVRRLLRGHTPYDGTGCLTRVAPFRKGLVSLPETVEGCPPFEDVAPPEVQRFLKGHPERMLRADSPSSTVTPYFDPALKRSVKTYRQFISDLRRRGLDGGQRLELILDARPANLLFEPPPGVSLLSTEGLSRVEIALPDGLGPWSEEAERLLGSYSLHVGLADVKDCFHRLRLPGWLSEYFCLPVVPAHLLDAEGQIWEGRTLERHDMVSPCWAVFPMGFTWNLWAAQRINEYQASSICPQLRESPLTDRGRPPVFGPSVPRGHVSHYVYVLNLGVASTDEPIVTDAIAQLIEGFDQRGLLLHGNSVGTEVETLGTEVSGALWKTRVTQKRFWLIRQALNGLLRRRRLTGWAVEVLVGHCTFAGLLSRGTLSVFHTVYDFMRKSHAEPRALWPEARQELEAFRGLLIFLESDWTLQWNDLVAATDSSLEAGAVSTTHWPRSLVAEVGRAQERTRFREPAAVETDGADGGAPAARRGAREAALEAAGFWRDADGEWRLAEGVNDDDELAAAWEAGPSFPEVPAAGLASSRWRTKQVQRWRFDGGGILIKEARALVMGVRRIAQSVLGAACRQLILSDNMLTAAQRAQDWLARLSLAELPPAPRLPEHERDLQALPQGWSRPIVADSDDGSSTSDDQQVAPAGERREKELLRRATRRRRAYGAEAALDSTAVEGQTFLERRSVFGPARDRYTQELEAFLDYCDRGPQRALTTASEVDEAMVDYMNHLFFEGHESAKGDQVMAGLMHRFPEFSKQGERKYILDLFSDSNSIGKAALKRGFNYHGFDSLNGPPKGRM